jgi:hypothetical protein
VVKFRSQNRHSKGPELVTLEEFNRRVKGDGIGFRVERGWGRKPGLVRIEHSVEVQHPLFRDDNGAGKTVAIFALDDQFELAGETCVYYDRDRQFLKRYWKPSSGPMQPNSPNCTRLPIRSWMRLPRAPSRKRCCIGIHRVCARRLLDIDPPTSELPGTGIGLALYKRIVERYGGRVWVDSSVQEGMAVQFTVPG